MNSTVLKKINLYLLFLFVLTLPYYISPALIGFFSMMVFLISLKIKNSNLKDLYKNSVVKVFSVFILFYLLTAFWGNSDIFNGEFKDAVDRFKYYPFLIIGIYFSSFEKKDIEQVLWLLAIAPIVYVILNYTNSLGLTNIYSTHYKWPSVIKENQLKFLMWDFRSSPFIIFSILFFYIKSFHLLKKDIKKASLYFLGSLVFFCSLFVDDVTHSRAMDIAIFLSLFYITFRFIKNKYKYFILAVVFFIGSSILWSLQKNEFQKGYEEVYTFFKENKYEGSFGFRLGMLNVGYQIFSESPIIGNGINNVTQKVEKIKSEQPYLFAKDKHLISFHNEHVLILVQTGLIGYALFIVWLIIYFRMNTYDENMLLIKNSIIIVFISLTIADYFITNKSTGTLFAFIMAIAISFNLQEKQDKKV